MWQCIVMGTIIQTSATLPPPQQQTVWTTPAHLSIFQTEITRNKFTSSIHPSNIVSNQSVTTTCPGKNCQDRVRLPAAAAGRNQLAKLCHNLQQIWWLMTQLYPQQSAVVLPGPRLLLSARQPGKGLLSNGCSPPGRWTGIGGIYGQAVKQSNWKLSVSISRNSYYKC